METIIDEEENLFGAEEEDDVFEDTSQHVPQEAAEPILPFTRIIAELETMINEDINDGAIETEPMLDEDRNDGVLETNSQPDHAATVDTNIPATRSLRLKPRTNYARLHAHGTTSDESETWKRRRKKGREKGEEEDPVITSKFILNFASMYERIECMY